MPGARAAKKSSTPTKGAKRAAGQRYEYTELNKVSLTSSETHHVYGVIIDATFPYKTNKDKYICSLKIVDPSLHSSGAKASDNDYATVVIYGSKFEDMPIVNRIGDIIRLHRATLRLYNNQRQFNVSTHWNGSWCLFSTDKVNPIPEIAGGQAISEFQPFAFSGKKASFEKHEAQLVGALRAWATKFFASNDAVTKDLYKALNKVSGSQDDFDVVAKIISVHEMDEYTNELKLRDSTGESWYTLALKLKFPHLRAGQAVRIRSATWDETSSQKNVLALSHYSNIMTFIGSSRLAAAVQKVGDDWSAEKAALAKDVPTHAITISEVDKKHANLPFTSLYDLFHAADTLQGDVFRTSFTVSKVEPADVKEFVKVYDKKSKKASSAKGGKGDLIWQVQFLAKDASTANNNNQYRILNYSHEGLGANFFGKAANLHTDAKARGAVEKHVANLTKFNVWVDAVVERRNGWYYIRDTRLR